ncbi:hypothetical protein [Nonomuraea soli]|uniref:Uncharacterized protein n=1 Tax=Nonomuraea soli TaxID=1032476 RepID=A0A7W0CGL9_9ACTN|nr:hypothetical protein [Nonomuraea soli]MBA2890778.1 hypothetical protein [Nonomuraea soli]
MQVIIPSDRPRYGLRMVAYAPNGARLGLLPGHLRFDAGLPLNDVPSLQLSYSGSALGADRLAQHCEIAIEYAVEATSWVEPLNGRFLRIKRSGESTDRAKARSYDCPGWAWQLRKLLLYPSAFMIDGKRRSETASPGDILTAFIDEGQGPGTLPGLVIDFTASHDSSGQPWQAELMIGVEPGTDLLAMLINLAEQGLCDWAMRGRTLRLWNAGTALARQLASGPAPVELRLGRDIDQAPDDASVEDAASSILVMGEESLNVEVTNPSAIMPWGRWEAAQSQGGVSDEGTARFLAQIALERAAGEAGAAHPPAQAVRRPVPAAGRLPRLATSCAPPATRRRCRACGCGR